MCCYCTAVFFFLTKMWKNISKYKANIINCFAKDFSSSPLKQGKDFVCIGLRARCLRMSWWNKQHTCQSCHGRDLINMQARRWHQLLWDDSTMTKGREGRKPIVRAGHDVDFVACYADVCVRKPRSGHGNNYTGDRWQPSLCPIIPTIYFFFGGGGRRRKEKCHKAMSFRVNTYLVRYVIQQSSSAGEFLKSHVSSKMKTERSY